MADSRRIEDLKRRVQQDPASIAFAALADEYRRAGLFQDAIETCRAGLLRHPSYLSARVTLGRALIEIGEFDEAQAQLEQVIRTAPDNLAAIRALADIHERRSEYHGTAEVPSTAPEPEPAPPAGAPRVIPMPLPVAKLSPESPAAAAAAPPAFVPNAVPDAPRADPAPTAPAAPADLAAAPRPPAAVTVNVNPAAVRLEAFLAAIQRARSSHPRLGPAIR